MKIRQSWKFPKWLYEHRSIDGEIYIVQQVQIFGRTWDVWKYNTNGWH